MLLSLIFSRSLCCDFTISANLRIACLTEGFSFCLNIFCEYSLNAIVRISASLPLKKTRYRGGFSELSFLSAKSIPYFFAVDSNDLIFLSVISMFERAVLCFIRSLMVCLPCFKSGSFPLR